MGYSVGIDVGGTNIRAAKIGPVEFSGEIADERRIKIPEDKNPLAIKALIKELVDSFNIAEDNLSNIGVGFAGMIDDNGNVRNAPAFGWRDVPFQIMLSQTFNRYVGLTNDLNAILLGEYNFGAAKGHENSVCVFVGTGVGAAAMAGFEVITGSSGVSFELGHVKGGPGPDRQCNCGQFGCLEAKAGGAFLTGVIERITLHERQDISDRDKINAALARKYLDSAGKSLGLAIANVCTLLNPSCLVMGGGMWNASSELRDICLEEINAKTNPPALEVMEIKTAALGDNAGVLGASTLD